MYGEADASQKNEGTHRTPYGSTTVSVQLQWLSILLFLAGGFLVGGSVWAVLYGRAAGEMRGRCRPHKIVAHQKSVAHTALSPIQNGPRNRSPSRSPSRLPKNAYM